MSDDWLKNPLSLFEVKGKVAVITGASGAFGALAARVLAGAGCKLVLTAGKKAELEQSRKECGGEVWAINIRPSTEENCNSHRRAGRGEIWPRRYSRCRFRQE